MRPRRQAYEASPWRSSGRRNFSRRSATRPDAGTILRAFANHVETVSVRDIVIIARCRTSLSHVAGIITEIPQTPLSHINLKAKQNHTPNAYIRDAAARPEVVALAGKSSRSLSRPKATPWKRPPEDVNAFFDSIGRKNATDAAAEPGHYDHHAPGEIGFWWSPTASPRPPT